MPRTMEAAAADAATLPIAQTEATTGTAAAAYALAHSTRTTATSHRDARGKRMQFRRVHEGRNHAPQRKARYRQDSGALGALESEHGGPHQNEARLGLQVHRYRFCESP